MMHELTKAMSLLLLFMLAVVVVFGSTTTAALAATKEMEATTPTQEQFKPTKALIAESLAQIDSAIASVVELVSIQNTEVATAIEIEAEKISPTVEAQLPTMVSVNQTIVEDAIIEEIIEDTGIAEEVIPGISIIIDDTISGDITPAEASTEIIEIVQQAANSTEITVGHVMQASDDPTVITEQIIEDNQ